MPIVITRRPSASLDRCNVSFIERQPIDIDRACLQHAAYCAALAQAGAEVIVLPALDALPDAVFVEDTAIVLDELAILAPMGAASRAAESAAIQETLERYRLVKSLQPPATLDGGDVLRIGRTLYIGRSARTNQTAIDQLRTLLTPMGYTVYGVPVERCLHLKTGVTAIGEDTIVVYPPWIDPAVFETFPGQLITVAESTGANTLGISDTVLVAANASHTREQLERAGIATTAVEIDELQKAEAGLTCMSLIVA